MKKLILILILQIFIIGGVYGSSFGETSTINGILRLKQCKLFLKLEMGTKLNSDEGGSAAICVGYISGFRESHESDEMILKVAPYLYCVPQEVTVGQIIRVFVKYLEDHPEELHKEGHELLHSSLIKAFPCPNQKK